MQDGNIVPAIALLLVNTLPFGNVAGCAEVPASVDPLNSRGGKRRWKTLLSAFANNW
jgi:hypothetical protein